MRRAAAIACFCLAACGPAPRPSAPVSDPADEAWYGRDAERLAAMVREAEGLFRSGAGDRAQAVIERAQPLQARLLAVPRPTLAAMEVASDLDDLYGRMLLRNRHYGWARLLFQKNASRWRNRQPQTPETARRLEAAQKALAECDRLIGE